MFRFPHNESRNYSFGTNISGGSAIAGAAMGMGMSASTYGVISSHVAAAGQIAGAAAMVLPGGAMGRGLANMGIICVSLWGLSSSLWRDRE